MVGRVGEDEFARVPIRALEEAGVDVAFVRPRRGAHTGTALIVVDASSAENAIAVAGGANRTLSPEDVRDAVAAFRSSGVLLVQLEAPLETVEAALDLARQSSVRTVLDPAPALELPDALLRKADVLTPNETEAEILTGVRVRDVESAAAAGSALRDRSLGDVVVTLGELGCVWVSTSGFEHIPSPRVAVVDTTGAGDAFNGALAVALARGERFAPALRFAARAGAAATLARGAARAMPTLDTLESVEGNPRRRSRAGSSRPPD
jgi:ribokinase